MEQHPIPQNVSSYQFKLVGDMTLKQFFQVAGGILVGIIFNSTPLLPIIKLPLAALSILLGVGLAFLPLEERPLEKWIFAFFRAIYSPTIFTWKKGSLPAKLFQDEPTISQNTPQDVALTDYLAKTNQAPTASGNLNKAEGNFFQNLAGLISSSLPHPTQTQKTPAVVPVQTPQTPIQQSVPPVSLNQTPSPVTTVSVTVPTPEKTNQTNTPNEIRIPLTPSIQVPSLAQNAPLAQPQAYPPTPATSTPVTPVMGGTNIISTTQAIFSPDAAPPSPSTYPNVVVGQVIDQDRRIVEGVIIEIRDANGRPVRALRSNKAGHFVTVTQLDNGHYEIITEKEGYEFKPIGFDATGVLIPPILIQGKRFSQFIEMPSVPVKPTYSIN